MSFGIARQRTLDFDGYGFVAADLPAFDPEDRAASTVDPRAWFATPDHPLEIEIGSGKGTFLVQEAAVRPGVNFLGIESAGEFFRYGADRLRRHALPNARMLGLDATEFIRFRLPDALATAIHLYFSDPWPKKRHHKRRVIQDRTLADFHRVLVPGGRLHIVTDHAELWGWCEAHVERHGALFERRDFEPPASAGAGELVGTNYERKFVREGRAMHAMTLVRSR